jgi:hypothetical protein
MAVAQKQYFTVANWHEFNSKMCKNKIATNCAFLPLVGKQLISNKGFTVYCN